MRSGTRIMALVGTIAVVVVSAGPAVAHERREVGPFEFVVGFWEEPAFANQPNGPEVSISRGGDPVVEDVELAVDVTFGAETTTYEIEPAFVVGVFGEEGSYNADLVPTRPGTYEFRFYGTVEGEEIDETFTSGPETFNDVNDPAEAAFPVADPSNAELAARLEQETARLSDDLAGARTLAFAGIALAILAILAAAALALRARRRPS